MKVTLTSTDKIVHLNGVPARIWQGTTENGVELHAYITRVAVVHDADATEFERDLQECEAPRADLGAIPLRLIL
jgi:hypothetical protein